MRLLLAKNMPEEVRSTGDTHCPDLANVSRAKQIAATVRQTYTLLPPPARPCGASVPHLTQEAHAWPSANA
jgi:hypothetical protein